MKNPDKHSLQNIRFYDEEAEKYDQLRYSSTAGMRVDNFHKSILDKFLIGSDEILELGCGTGRLLANFNSSKKLYGIDFSTGMLEIAKRRLSERSNIDLRQGDIRELPFGNETFDAVYSILVLNLISDLDKVFQEVKRVLRPEGLFIFNIPNLASIYFLGGLYVNLRGRTVTSNNAGSRSSHWFSPKEWKDLLKKHRFELISVLGQPPLLRSGYNLNPVDATGVGLFFSKSIYIVAKNVS